jgi:LacI family transcriptional regulator
MWPGLEIAGVVEAHDDAAEAYDKCRDLLTRRRPVTGVYVSTANSLPVLKALEDDGLSNDVTVVTTDLFPGLLPHIASGRVAATIHQRPWTQGRIVFETLHHFLADGVTPPSFIGLPPHIVMKSNLKLFLERIRSGWGEEAEEFPRSEETGGPGPAPAEAESTPVRARGSS